MAQNRLESGILEGIITYNDLTEHYSWAKPPIDYTPDATKIQELALHANNLTFVVVLGTWCSDSKEHIPAFYKIAQLAGIPDSSIQFIGTLRNKKTTFIDLEPLCIEYVPTFFVFYDGKSIGKIVETPEVTIESDLVSFIKKYLH